MICFARARILPDMKQYHDLLESILERGTRQLDYENSNKVRGCGAIRLVFE